MNTIYDTGVSVAERYSLRGNVLGHSAGKDYVDENRSELTTFSHMSVSHRAYDDNMETTDLHDYAKSGHESRKN